MLGLRYLLPWTAAVALIAPAHWCCVLLPYGDGPCCEAATMPEATHSCCSAQARHEQEVTPATSAPDSGQRPCCVRAVEAPSPTSSHGGSSTTFDGLIAFPFVAVPVTTTCSTAVKLDSPPLLPGRLQARLCCWRC